MVTYYLVMEQGTYLLVFYCGSMCSVYLKLLAMLFAMFFNDHVAYLIPLTSREVITKIMFCLAFVLGMFVYVTGIDFMSRLH